jgi:hypothetical protein
VTVTVTCTDDGSGVDEGGIAVRQGAGPFVPYEGPFTLSQEGTTSIEARCPDAAGNLGFASAEVRKDTTPPQLFAVASLVSAGPVDVQLSAQDGTSGLFGFLDLQEESNLGIAPLGSPFTTVARVPVSGPSFAGTVRAEPAIVGLVCYQALARDAAGNAAVSFPACTMHAA